MHICSFSFSCANALQVLKEVHLEGSVNLASLTALCLLVFPIARGESHTTWALTRVHITIQRKAPTQARAQICVSKHTCAPPYACKLAGMRTRKRTLEGMHHAQEFILYTCTHAGQLTKRDSGELCLTTVPSTRQMLQPQSQTANVSVGTTHGHLATLVHLSGFSYTNPTSPKTIDALYPPTMILSVKSSAGPV